MSKQQFLQNLETFGSILYANTGKDFQKSNEALESLNKVLIAEPKLVGFIMNPENQTVLGEIIKSIDGKEPSLMDITRIMGKLKKLKV